MNEWLIYTISLPADVVGRALLRGDALITATTACPSSDAGWHDHDNKEYSVQTKQNNGVDKLFVMAGQMASDFDLFPDSDSVSAKQMVGGLLSKKEIKITVSFFIKKSC